MESPGALVAFRSTLKLFAFADAILRRVGAGVTALPSGTTLTPSAAARPTAARATATRRRGPFPAFAGIPIDGFNSQAPFLHQSSQWINE
jgi:hypothetical protein